MSPCHLWGERRQEAVGYRICPYCNARLDPDERCDCREEAELQQEDIHSKHNKKEEQHYE